MVTDPKSTPWLKHALLAMSEGMCPEHSQPLREDGVCVQCQCWWEADFSRQTVVTKYPYPEGWLEDD